MLAPSDATCATYSVDFCWRSHYVSIIWCVSLKTGA